MMLAKVSDRGQISIPAAARRKLGIKPKSDVTIDVTENEIIIRPAKSILDVAGVFHFAAKGKTQDWEEIISATEAAVAREVENESNQ